MNKIKHLSWIQGRCFIFIVFILGDKQKKTNVLLKTLANNMIIVKTLKKEYHGWDLNPHERIVQGILSPSCLPFHHHGIVSF